MKLKTGFAAAFLLLTLPAVAATAPTPRETVAAALGAAAWDGRVPSSFVLTYRSEGRLWGAETFVLRADGRLTRSGPGPTDALVTKTVRVSHRDVVGVIRLLVELEAWRQRPVRRFRDGSRADIRVRVGRGRTTVWEWETRLGTGPRFGKLKIRLINLSTANG